MKNTITYLQPLPTTKKILGITLLFFAIYNALFYSILVGFLMIAFAVFIVLTEGVQINFNNDAYRNINSLFGIHFGKWKSIPEFEYISVFKGKQKQRVNTLATSNSLSNEIFYLNLFYNRNRHITFYKTLEKEDALEIASKFQKELKLDILDATEQQKVWLEYKNVC